MRSASEDENQTHRPPVSAGGIDRDGLQYILCVDAHPPVAIRIPYHATVNRKWQEHAVRILQQAARRE